MIDTTEEHIKHEYFIHISNNTDRNICVVTTPKNINLGFDKTTTIYELENGCVTIYQDGKKLCNYTCCEYAKRIVVYGHMLRLIEDRGLRYVPAIIEDSSNNNKHTYEYFDELGSLLSILEPPSGIKNEELEIVLSQEIHNLAMGIKDISPDVLDGFLECRKIFNGE